MNKIKEIAKRKEAENGRITQKELLWYMVDKFDEYEKRISKIEAIQKIFLLTYPVLIGIIWALR